MQYPMPMSSVMETRVGPVTTRRGAAVAVYGTALLLLFADFPAEAQVVRLVGSVQWVAGSKMQVLAEGGASVAVDLTEADQSSYRALRNGEWVVVDGLWSSDRRAVIALDIWRDSGRGYWTQSP